MASSSTSRELDDSDCSNRRRWLTFCDTNRRKRAWEKSSQREREHAREEGLSVAFYRRGRVVRGRGFNCSRNAINCGGCNSSGKKNSRDMIQVSARERAAGVGKEASPTMAFIAARREQRGAGLKVHEDH
jgi:hypothetical protein